MCKCGVGFGFRLGGCCWCPCSESSAAARACEIWSVLPFAIRHHSALIEALGLELRRPPSDSSLRYFLDQVDVAALCAAIREWTIAQIHGGTADLNPLVCDGKTLRGSVRSSPGPRSLSVYCTGHAGSGYQSGLLRHRRKTRARGAAAAARRTGSRGCGDPGGHTPCSASVFRHLQEQGADFLLTVRGNQKTLHGQIHSQFQGKRKIPFVAMDHEVSHGRVITCTLRAKLGQPHIAQAWVGTWWIVEVTASETCDGSRFRPPTYL